MQREIETLLEFQATGTHPVLERYERLGPAALRIVESPASGAPSSDRIASKRAPMRLATEFQDLSAKANSLR